MTPEIKEYSEALAGYMEARRLEVKSRFDVQKAHHRLLMAKDALRNMENDALSDIERS